jgi:hypothetical protein
MKALTIQFLLTEWRMSTTLKTCFQCQLSKPLPDFYQHPQMSDGYLGKCKDCTRASKKNGHEPGKILSRWVLVAESGCWQWQLKIDQKTGYGWKTWGSRSVLAHRWMYEMFNGPIPSELVLDHLCRNRACVNPAHLEAVTQSTNCRRGKNAKLSLENIAEIQQRLDAGEPVISIAQSFGISESYARSLRLKESA